VHGIPSCPWAVADADVPAIGDAVRELEVVRPKAFTLAVAEGEVASAGSGSRQRTSRMTGVKLSAADRAQARSARLTVGGVAAAGELRVSSRWPPPLFYSAARRGPTS
jgi:hypothetical protein